MTSRLFCIQRRRQVACIWLSQGGSPAPAVCQCCQMSRQAFSTAIGGVACEPRPQVTMRHRNYSPPGSAAAIYWSRFSIPHFAVSGGVIAGGRRPIWRTAGIPIMRFTGGRASHSRENPHKKINGSWQGFCRNAGLCRPSLRSVSQSRLVAWCHGKQG